MIDWFILLCLIVEIAILAKLERIWTGTWVTPFTLLAFPYVCIVGITFFLAPRLGFIALHMESVLVWMLGLLLFWSGGLVVALAYGRTMRQAVQSRLTMLHEGAFEMLLLIVAWLAIGIIATRLWTLIGSVGGVAGLTREFFPELYGSGWVGHVMDFSKLLLIFFIGTVRRGQLLKSVTIAAIVILLVPYQSKGSLMLPLASGLIYRMLSGRMGFSVSNLVFVVVTAVFLYGLAYFFGYGENTVIALFDVDNYVFLAQHFMSYLFSGVLAFGDAVSQGVVVREHDRSIIFAPFLNLYAVVTSSPVVSIVTDYYSDLDNGRTSNVHTLFGTLTMFLGYFGALVYILILAPVLYLIYAVAIITRNCWILAVFSLLAGGLVFAWFEFYYWSLTMYEVSSYGAVLAMLAHYGRRQLGSSSSPVTAPSS